MRIDIELTPLQEKWIKKELLRLNAKKEERLKVTKRELMSRLIDASRMGVTYK